MGVLRGVAAGAAADGEAGVVSGAATGADGMGSPDAEEGWAVTSEEGGARGAEGVNRVPSLASAQSWSMMASDLA